MLETGWGSIIYHLIKTDLPKREVSSFARKRLGVHTLPSDKDRFAYMTEVCKFARKRLWVHTLPPDKDRLDQVCSGGVQLVVRSI